MIGRSLIFLTSTIAILLLVTGCGEKHVGLTPAPTVPAAIGSADLSPDDNGNTVVDLKVQHLAKPEDLKPSRAVYVVWIQPPGADPIKQGQLKVNDNLEGELRTPTTYKRFKIFITAEDSASVIRPSGQEVFHRDIID